jgi:hypothetical protein
VRAWPASVVLLLALAAATGCSEPARPAQKQAVAPSSGASDSRSYDVVPHDFTTAEAALPATARVISPTRTTAKAETCSPVELQRQRDLLDQLKFELEVAREEASPETPEELEARKWVATTKAGRDPDAAILRLQGTLVEAELQITDPELRDVLRAEVVKPLLDLRRALAESKAKPKSLTPAPRRLP